MLSAAQNYALNVAPASVARPVVPTAGKWIDDLTVQLGDEARRRIAGWLASGLDKQKLSTALQTAPNMVYERLCNAKKSIYQQRVIIDDYERIPGVDKKMCIANGLPRTAISASDFGVNDSAYDLPDRNAPTFTDNARLVELKPGDKIYRVTSDPVNDKYAKTGGYWTRNPPVQLAEVIGGIAVIPEWNNFQRVYEFTVPKPELDVDFKEVLPKVYVWEGPTAAQPVSLDYEEKAENGHCLTGGDPQIFVPNVISRNLCFSDHIKDVTTAHKSW